MTAPNKKGSAPKGEPRVTLKTVAEHLGLTPGTISAALNNSAAASSIPERTKKRILAAAKDLNYRPNYFARSLRLQRTYTIGVIAEEIGDAYGSLVITRFRGFSQFGMIGFVGMLLVWISIIPLVPS